MKFSDILKIIFIACMIFMIVTAMSHSFLGGLIIGLASFSILYKLKLKQIKYDTKVQVKNVIEALNNIDKKEH
ncbi:MAG: hypothetical protein IJB82_02355 [Bacilli bacterium]|nr:hypothetical protein [Bacilli bacterium]